MPIVYVPAGVSRLMGGKPPLEVAGSSVREIVDNLEKAWPGIREHLTDGHRLRPGISVAVDGVVSPVGLLEPVSPDSEVHFVAAISGG